MNIDASGADIETLASACYAVIDEIEEVAGHSAVLGDSRGQIASLREKRNARGLAGLLKELMKWTNTLPRVVREAVAQHLSARGLDKVQEIDPQRVKRTLERGTISTASEYRAVQEYVDNPPDNVPAESLDRLAAMLVEFGVKKGKARKAP